LGFGFWVSIGWLVLLVLVAILAPVLPFKDPDQNFIGHGLPAEEERGPGIGLRNMAERIEQLGGEFRLTSRRSGLEILVKVPRAGLRDFDEEQENAA
ncbi:MAG: hypothetical protein AAF401_13940, partial [Pseudomonadota bacterium]